MTYISRYLFAAAAMASLALAPPSAVAEFPVPGLSQDDFRQLGDQGFGDRGNSYAWGMEFFKGKLYIGTNRHFLCMIGGGVSSTGATQNPEIPRECEPDLLDMDLRARIYTYDPATGVIDLIHVSPTFSALLSDGTRVDAPRAVGYRTMTVFREPDGTEALYVGSFTHGAIPSVGAQILRSADGQHFEEIALQLPYASSYYSFRSLTVYKNRLFVLGLSSDPNAPDLLESTDPVRQGFRAVNEPGFGDPANAGAFELSTFAGYLYVGTFAALDGFQLLKTQAVGAPPYEYETVLVEGAYRGIKNQSVLSLQPYKNHLYLGTGIYFGSANLIPDFRPSSAELLRVKPDDTWEIVCGEERNTPDGFKKPITGAGPGFGNPFIGYMWRMAEHDGVLYLGTLDNSVFAQYAEDLDVDAIAESADLSQFPGLLPLIETVGADEVADVISAIHGGFDFWRTVDGRVWQAVSWTGFGDSFSYGVRNLVSTDAGLFLGTANPFLGMRVHLGQPPGTDSDGDNHPDPDDNCPLTWNLNQADLDGDGVGDVCDPDQDGDCIADRADPSPRRPNPSSADTQSDDDPDPCDADDDKDGVLDVQDNCPQTPNSNQMDQDGDGTGDECQSDSTPGAPRGFDAVGVSGEDGDSESGKNDAIHAQRGAPRPCGITGAAVLWATLAGLFALRLHPRRATFGPGAGKPRRSQEWVGGVTRRNDRSFRQR